MLKNEVFTLKFFLDLKTLFLKHNIKHILNKRQRATAVYKL